MIKSTRERRTDCTTADFDEPRHNRPSAWDWDRRQTQSFTRVGHGKAGTRNHLIADGVWQDHKIFADLPNNEAKAMSRNAYGDHQEPRGSLLAVAGWTIRSAPKTSKGADRPTRRSAQKQPSSAQQPIKRPKWNVQESHQRNAAKNGGSARLFKKQSNLEWNRETPG